MLDSLQDVPLFDEDPQDLADLVQALADEFHPEGPYEERCVEGIAINQWRLHVRPSYGRTQPDLAILEKLNRYETALNRQIDRFFETLLRLQSMCAAPVETRHVASPNCASLSAASRNSPSPNAASPNSAQERELAAIHQEILGYLLDLSSASQANNTSESDELPDKANLLAAIEEIEENDRTTDQTQSLCQEPYP